MRFHLGPIPDEFNPDRSWRPIREPGPILMQFIAVPMGVGAVALVGYCWHCIGVPPALRFQNTHAALILGFILLSFPALILAHEFLHAAVHPRFGFTPATIIGAWPKRFLFYAHYSGRLTRERFLAVFAMPTLIITVLPLAAAAIGLLPPNVALPAMWFSTWNAFFACGDYLGIALIFFQLPRGATVQNKSWHTYWKPL